MQEFFRNYLYLYNFDLSKQLTFYDVLCQCLDSIAEVGLILEENFVCSFIDMDLYFLISIISHCKDLNKFISFL